jgi:cysteine-rich repeat protein
LKINKVKVILIILSLFTISSCVEVKEEIEIIVSCGNGHIDPGEECDDGNIVDHDGCTADCRIESFCGNSIVEPGEECDDGNYEDEDGCSRSCFVEFGCGNGVLEVGEECDDDNIDSGDGCNGECIIESGLAVCGNGVHEYPEICDDGNVEPGDGCDSTCQKENGCGDGILTPPEQCDDKNGVEGDGCSNECLVEFICGNGDCSIEQGENCELCPVDCCPNCGNGILNDGEECDDGDNSNGDGCSRGCTDEDGSSDCGNSLWEIGEECDDGNDVEHDGCSPECVKEYVCGDGECFGDEGETCANCGLDCCPACGNGIKQTGEVCDTDDLNGATCVGFGYEGGSLSCTTWCDFDYSACQGAGPGCGNGIKEYGEECDGSDLNNDDCLSLGFLGGITFCDGNCQFNLTGCTDKIRYFFEDFDDIVEPQGWSFSYPFEWGTPEDIGPSAAFSGSRCVGTSIGGAAPTSSDYASTYVDTPAIDLTGSTNPVFYFWAYVDMDDYSGYDENWRVEYSLNGTNWTIITNMDPVYNDGSAYTMVEGADVWAPYIANLQNIAGESTVYLRISAQFDHYGTYSGVYVDDMMVVEGEQIPVTITTASGLGSSVVGFPFNRTINVWGGSGDFTFSFEGSHPAWLSIDSVTGIVSGTPQVGDIGSDAVTIKVLDNQNPLNMSEKIFSFDVFDAVYYEDFESGFLPTGWSIGGSIWEYGMASTNGPSACNSGSYCIGTDFSSDYPDNMDWDNCITTSTIDLSTLSAASLTFRGWRETETNYDGGICEIESGGVWSDSSTHTPPYNEDNGSRMTWSGNQSVWEDFAVDLDPYVGGPIRVRWCFYSDSSSVYSGWFIDDLTIIGN